MVHLLVVGREAKNLLVPGGAPSCSDKRLNRTARPSYISPKTFSKAFLAAAAVPQALAANLPPVRAKNEQPLTRKAGPSLRSG